MGGLMRLVMMPGMDGTGDLFARFEHALGGRMATRIVRYPAIESRYEVLRACAREALPKGEDFVLLGESFSGPLAIELAAEKPRGLRGLILVCSYARTPRPLLG